MNNYKQLYPKVSGTSVKVDSEGSSYTLNEYLDQLFQTISPDMCLGTLAKKIHFIGDDATTLKTFVSVGNLPAGTDVFNLRPIQVLKLIYTQSK